MDTKARNCRNGFDELLEKVYYLIVIKHVMFSFLGEGSNETSYPNSY